MTARPELRRISGSPLLLTMMVVVHVDMSRLADARAMLYAECTELLLPWHKEPDQPDVLERWGLPDFRQTDLLKLMAELSSLAHEGARRDGDNQNEPADLSRDWVLRTLERTFAPYTSGDERRRDALVGMLLHEIAGRNGLMLKRSAEGGEAYAFPHCDYLKLCRERAAESYWREALRSC